LAIELIKIPNSGELLGDTLETILRELKIQIDNSSKEKTESMNNLLLLII